MAFAADQPAGDKYVICNADGDQARLWIVRFWKAIHMPSWAMAIAGYAIGASRGMCISRGIPDRGKTLTGAIEQAKELGLFGEHILGTDFSFDIEIRLGAGAFVCGEETALIQSIEGKRGMPVPKPPFPAVSGVWGRPTIINNVETFANVAQIILKGSNWFSSIGTEKSKGTKVFALGGKIVNTGLVEIPWDQPR
ncbi:MAG: hypothetical protein ACLSA6_16835 [Holdemania massiliensis]